MKRVSIIICLMIVLSIPSFASSIGVVTQLEGNPGIVRKGIKINEKEMPIYVGDTFKTENGQKAMVKLDGRALFTVAPSTIVKFKKKFVFIKRGNTVFQVFKQTKKFRVYTPSVTIGVYGTRFSVAVDDHGTTDVELFDGSVKVTAIKGKKEVVRMVPGQKVKVTNKGVLKMMFAKKNEAATEKIITNNTEVEEVLSEELETSGSIRYSVMPARNGSKPPRPMKIPFRILVNNCMFLNGKELLSFYGNSLQISGLEEETYGMTVMINGIPYKWDIDFSSQDEKRQKIIEYRRFRIIVSIGDLRGLKAQRELVKLKGKVFYEDQCVELPVVYDLSKKTTDKIMIYEATFEGGALLFYYPVEYDTFPLLELEYTGDADVETKIIKLQIVSNRGSYSIKF